MGLMHENLPPQTMRLELSRMQRIMEALGNPQNATPVIHLAGTNGKGSVAAILTSILSAAGYQVGTLISPHLISATERILLNGEPIPEKALSEALHRIQTQEKAWTQDDPKQALSYFELMIAAGFDWLWRQGVDLMIVETGLGGRLDATNVIQNGLKNEHHKPRPLCINVITSIGMDHSEILGHTLEQIAFEKAGIFKQGAHVILGPKTGIPDVADIVLRNQAQAKGVASLTQAIFPPSWQTTASPTGWQIIQTDHPDSPALHFPLLGSHQLDNLACAVSVLEVIQEVFPVSDSALQNGLGNVVWPARMTTIIKTSAQTVSQALPVLMIDGSHNEAGFVALIDALKHHAPNRPIHWRLSVLQNRDISAFASILRAYERTEQIVLYCPDPQRFHKSCDGLQSVAWPESLELDLAKSSQMVLKAFSDNADEPPEKAWQTNRVPTAGSLPLIIYTGSLYAAGNCLEHLAKQN
ncbi:MAG: hypothetical protein VKK59_05925 [Vampirovibrionales bacterium]|nr:hypothetical protein [Vampirovibrionales bacterium]